MPLTHEFVLDFLKMREGCNPAELERYLDDDVDWLLSGPVDFLPYCGHRKGKAAVVDMICRISAATFENRSFEIKHLLVQGDCAATLSRFQATHAASKRTISYRSAHFMRFRDSRLVWFRGLIDSFSATEQIMGHELDLAHTPELIALAPNDDLVEI